MPSKDKDELRRTNYEVAEAIAPGWERRRAFVEEVATPIRDWMVLHLAARPGQTVLELAAGASDTGYDVAAALGETGQLISTDLSPRMLDVARRRGAERGVRNVDYRVMDAEAIDLDTDSVDGVLCRFGYMLMPDVAAALAETRRVLRPGGRLALAVWDAPERNPFFAAVAMALTQRGLLPPPDPAGPGIFSMGDTERTRMLLTDAGFGTVHTEEIPVVLRVHDIDDYLAITTDTAGPIALALRNLSDVERDEVKTQLEDAYQGFASDSGYEIPGVALCAEAS